MHSILSALYSAGLASIALLPASADPVAILDIDQKPQPGTTSIWSPLVQASWEKLKSNHAGKLLRVEPSNPLVNKLERFTWNMDQAMPPGGYAIYAGPDTPEFAKATAADVKKRFHFDLTPSALPQNGRGDAYYGVLVRNMPLEKKFFRSKQKALIFTDGNANHHQVQFFGTTGSHSSHFASSVDVLKYEAQGKSFILSINTHRQDEQIIVFRPDAVLSIKDGIREVQRARSKPLKGEFHSDHYKHLRRNDTVKIPYLKLDIRTDFTTHLKGKYYYAGEPAPWQITKAYQITQFNFSEKGARIRVQSAIDDAPFGSTPPDHRPKVKKLVPRNFICDQPFFVFAWRDGASVPYFAAWIDGPDALLPFQVRQ